jgi:hypothetical protein
MFKVTVSAAATYPDDYRMKVQKQTLDSVWVDDGDPVLLAPGKKDAFEVSATSRFYVGADNPVPMRGELRFGGNGEVKVSQESWDGTNWQPGRVFENPDSPFYLFDVGLWRFLVETF